MQLKSCVIVWFFLHASHSFKNPGGKEEIWNYISSQHHKVNGRWDIKYKTYYFLKAIILLFSSLETLKLNKNNQNDSNLSTYLKPIMFLLIGFTQYYINFMSSSNLISMKQQLTDNIRKELIKTCFNKKIAFYEKFGATQVRDAIDEMPDLVYNSVCNWYEEGVQLSVLILMIGLKLIAISSEGLQNFFSLEHLRDHQYFTLYLILSALIFPLYKRIKAKKLDPAIINRKNSRFYAKEQIDNALNNIYLINSEAKEKEEVVHLVNLYKKASQKHLEFEFVHERTLFYVIIVPAIAILTRFLWAYSICSDENRIQELKNIDKELKVNLLIGTMIREFIKNKHKQKINLLNIETFLSFVFSAEKSNNGANKKFIPKQERGQIVVDLAKKYEYLKDS